MSIKTEHRRQTILQIVAHRSKTSAQKAVTQSAVSISQIQADLPEKASTPTLNRDIAALVDTGYLRKIGDGRATAYRLGAAYRLFAPVDRDSYFEREPAQREALTTFNYELFSALEAVPLFTPSEADHLAALKQEHQNRIAAITPMLYQKELERLTIDLSWKSSQIEGNTYSLLETERLFSAQETADGKTQDEATMLFNHKICLEFLLQHKGIGAPLNLAALEDIHNLLIKDLGVGRNLRARIVGITGTDYKPPDNLHQIKEAVETMCATINARHDGFEKSLLAVACVSYIQPFEDGNKRTARMVGNAMLIADGACPLSYRSVDSLDYKKALLIFYEQNNLSSFKELFLQQVEFAVKNYF